MALEINVRTSEANKAVIQDLTNRFQFDTQNYVARIGLAYSLSLGRKLGLDDIKDGRGKEYKEKTLLGRHKPYYIALISQLYSLHKTDEDIPKYIKMHVDDGLERMATLFNESKNYSALDFLLQHIEKGIDDMEGLLGSAGYVQNNFSEVKKDVCDKLIELHVGKNLDSGEAIYFRMNDINAHNNAHTAIAGNSGTGKTYFAKSLIKQIVEQTDGQVNFLFLDFKGLSEEDAKSHQEFFDSADAELINAPHKPFPINPLSFIDIYNEQNRIMGINKFVSIVADYSNLGMVQQQTLKDATTEAFSSKNNKNYPTFKAIYEKVKELNEKPDSLTKIMQSLSEYTLFDESEESASGFLQNNYYFSLSGSLSSEIRYTATFLVINYIYNVFMNMAKAPIDQERGIQSMRYVLLIDEAHAIFKEKKAQPLLEKMLREIRSQGVSVILLSQGIQEFNQPSFDFSEMCETAFLFDIKDKSNTKLLNKFMGFSDGSKEAKRLKASMERIKKYQIASNLKEFEQGGLFGA